MVSLPVEATGDDGEERATLADDEAKASADEKDQPTCGATGSGDEAEARANVGESEERVNDDARKWWSVGSPIDEEEGGSESGDEGKGSADGDTRGGLGLFSIRLDDPHRCPASSQVISTSTCLGQPFSTGPQQRRPAVVDR